MIWFIGIFVYLFCVTLTFDILMKTGYFDLVGFPIFISIFWPIFWAIYLSYHILKYPASFFVKCFNMFTTFVAERMK